MTKLRPSLCSLEPSNGCSDRATGAEVGVVRSTAGWKGVVRACPGKPTWAVAKSRRVRTPSAARSIPCPRRECWVRTWTTRRTTSRRAVTGVGRAPLVHRRRPKRSRPPRRRRSQGRPTVTPNCHSTPSPMPAMRGTP